MQNNNPLLKNRENHLKKYIYQTKFIFSQQIFRTTKTRSFRDVNYCVSHMHAQMMEIHVYLWEFTIYLRLQRLVDIWEYFKAPLIQKTIFCTQSTACNQQLRSDIKEENPATVSVKSRWYFTLLHINTRIRLAAHKVK